MSPFNPTPQTAGPGPIAEFKGITPVADESTATAIKGFSNVLGQGIHAADAVIKEDIKDQAYKLADTERDSFTGALSSALSAVKSGAGKTLGILPQGDGENSVPEGVQDGLATIGTLETAKGKISSMMYWGRLTAAAKDLRSQYPGYREYIDQEMQKITGHNPANAYMTSIIQDLNRSATASQDTFAKKIEAEIFKPENAYLPGMPEQVAKWRQTQDHMAMFTWLNKQNAWRTEDAKKTSTITLGNLDRTAKSNATEAQAMVEGQNLTINALDTLTLNIPGTNGSDGDTKRIVDYITEAKASGKLADPQTSELIGGALAAKRAQIDAALDRSWSQKIDGTDESKFSRMGPEKAKAVKQQVLSAFDRTVDLIYNQNYGDAFATKKFMEAKLDKAQAGLLVNTSTAESTMKMAVTRRLLGDQAAGVLIADAYGGPFKDSLGTYFQDNINSLIAQPGIELGKPPKTFNDVLNHAKNNGIGTPNNPDGTAKDPAKLKEEASYLNKVVKQINIIADPTVKDDRAKLNIAKAAFSPENATFLNHFITENRDPQTGQIVPGQHSVFKQWTSPAITKEMYRLGKDNPEVWDNYKNWVNQSWGRILFRNDILQMNNIASSPELKIGWDTEKQQWTEPQLHYNKSQPFHLNEQDLLKAKTQVRLVNQSLESLKNVNAAEGESNPAPQIMKSFLDAGVKFQNIPSTLTGELIRSMIMGNKTPQDTPGSPTDAPGSRKTETPLPTPTPTGNNAPASVHGEFPAPPGVGDGSKSKLKAADYIQGDISHYTSEDGQITLAQFLADPTLGAKTQRFVKKGAKPDSTNLGDVLSIDYGQIQHTRNGKVIRTEPGQGVVIP